MKFLILFFLFLAFISNLGNVKNSLQYLGTFYTDWAEKLQSTRVWLQDMNRQFNDPSNFQKLLGFTNYLFSGANPTTIRAEMQNNSNSDQYKPVQIRYVPYKGSSNVITSDASGNCNKIPQRRDLIETVQPTLYVEDKFTIEEGYVRDNNENGMDLQMRLNMEFRDCMRNVREDMNRQLLAKAAGLVGANPAADVGAGSYKDVPLIIGTSGKIDDRYFDLFKNEQEDNYTLGDLALVGLGNARRYMNRLGVGNANDAGIDYRLVMAEFGMSLFKDHFAPSVLGGANRVLAFYPGSVQFFNYNVFRGSFAHDYGDIIKGTMPDPILPISYDYTFKYDDGCETGNGVNGAYVGRVISYFDLWTIPEAAWGDVYSDLNDFNAIVGYNITES